jgi:hypothetical protein
VISKRNASDYYKKDKAARQFAPIPMNRRPDLSIHNNGSRRRQSEHFSSVTDISAGCRRRLRSLASAPHNDRLSSRERQALQLAAKSGLIWFDWV